MFCIVELLQLVWIETPTNPTLKVIDIQACADTVHKHKDVLLVVDNTFMSAYFQVSTLFTITPLFQYIQRYIFKTEAQPRNCSFHLCIIKLPVLFLNTTHVLLLFTLVKMVCKVFYSQPYASMIPAKPIQLSSQVNTLNQGSQVSHWENGFSAIQKNHGFQFSLMEIVSSLLKSVLFPNFSIFYTNSFVYAVHDLF